MIQSGRWKRKQVIAKQPDRDNKYRMLWEHNGGLLKTLGAEEEGREIGTNFPEK